MNAQRVVPLIAASRRRPAGPTPEQRVVYELARLRVAHAREPRRSFAHLTRSHD